MPRAPRAFPAETALHIVNRGNDRRRLFATDREYARFLVLIRRAARDCPLRLLAYVLMPNHWHLVVWPEAPHCVPRFLQRLTGAHAAGLRRATRTVGEGHVYQGRYFAVQLESEIRLRRTLRYVEANPVRARIVERAEQWRWSSLAERLRSPLLISPPPLELPPLSEWIRLVNTPLPPTVLSALRPARRRRKE